MLVVYSIFTIKFLLLSLIVPCTFNLSVRPFSRLQSGVSGNAKDGCDAIVIGERYDKRCLIEDGINKLTYVAESYCGSLSLFQSALQNKPIRVFRSSKSHGIFKPISHMENMSNKVFYRYDGLYRIITNAEHYAEIGLNDCTKQRRTSLSFYFRLQRLQKGCTNDMNLLNVDQFETKYVNSYLPQTLTFRNIKFIYENAFKQSPEIAATGKFCIWKKQIPSRTDIHRDPTFVAMYDTKKLIFHLGFSEYAINKGYDHATLYKQITSINRNFLIQFYTYTSPH